MLLGPRTALGAAYPFACVTSFSTTRSSSFPHPHSVPAAARRRPTRRGDAVFGGKPPAASSNPRRRRRRQVLQPGRTQVLETPRRPAFKISASFFFAATKCFFAGTSFKFCYQVFGFLFEGGGAMPPFSPREASSLPIDQTSYALYITL